MYMGGTDKITPVPPAFFISALPPPKPPATTVVFLTQIFVLKICCAKSARKCKIRAVPLFKPPCLARLSSRFLH